VGKPVRKIEKKKKVNRGHDPTKYSQSDVAKAFKEELMGETQGNEGRKRFEEKRKHWKKKSKRRRENLQRGLKKKEARRRERMIYSFTLRAGEDDPEGGAAG